MTDIGSPSLAMAVVDIRVELKRLVVPVIPYRNIRPLVRQIKCPDSLRTH